MSTLSDILHTILLLHRSSLIISIGVSNYFQIKKKAAAQLILVHSN